MTFEIFAKQALEQAKSITGKPITDEETQNVAFHLAAAMMAHEFANRK